MVKFLTPFVLIPLLASCAPEAVAPPIRFEPNGTPPPLVMLLHGVGQTDVVERWGLPVDALAPTAPTGTWDASMAYQSTNDDVAELSGLLEGALAPGYRAVVMGEGNGAFMAWRLACTRPDLVGAVVMLNGAANALDDVPCANGFPFSTLDVHGTIDDVIQYSGGRLAGMPSAYPSAPESVKQERERAGCEDLHMAPEPLFGVHEDAEVELCQRFDAPRAEHWRMIGWDHSPTLPATWGDLVYGWTLIAIGAT